MQSRRGYHTGRGRSNFPPAHRGVILWVALELAEALWYTLYAAKCCVTCPQACGYELQQTLLQRLQAGATECVCVSAPLPGLRLGCSKPHFFGICSMLTAEGITAALPSTS